MDSLTQFALGAAVGAAVLGRRAGPRRAALIGGVLGTLPDFDVFFPFDDAVDAFVLHRGPTHSLLVQAAATPLVAEPIVRLVRGLRDRRALTWLAVYLVFATHALLDALTVYGTRIFWPIRPDPVSIGSVFVVDPFYTVPLLVAVLWALCCREWTRRFGRALAASLAISTAYLGWGLVAQQWALAHARAILADAGVVPERTIATPTPLNGLVWRAVAIDGDSYMNIYIPLHRGRSAASVYRHARGAGAEACLERFEAARRVAEFARGFYRVERVNGGFAIADLRMGLTPNYVFRYVVAQANGDRLQETAPRRAPVVRSAEGDLDWLLATIAGRPAVRPAEAHARVRDLRALERAAAAPTPESPPLC